jgi:Domain of unknown function (DUF4440)
MNAHQTDGAELLDLNRRSFKAEDEHSEEKLGPILAGDFRIVRANWQTEGKEQMLDRIASDTSEKVREIDEENVKIYGDSAVVTSRVTLKEKSGGVVGYYWNTKVFAKREGRWQCTAWQVAMIP